MITIEQIKTEEEYQRCLEIRRKVFIKTRIAFKTPVTDNFGCLDFFRKVEGKLI